MKICPECKTEYDNLDYKYCPKCSSELIDEIDFFIMQFIEENKFQRIRCKKCNKLFQDDFKYCPYCSEKLIVEDIFTIDKENRLVIGKWNDDLVSISFEQLFDELNILSDPPIISFIEVFMKKMSWDEKFDNDLKDATEKLSRLTFQEVYLLTDSYRLMDMAIQKNVIGFKTLDLIEKEYGISNINFTDDYKVIKINDDKIIMFYELRKNQLYYLIEVIDKKPIVDENKSH